MNVRPFGHALPICIALIAAVPYPVFALDWRTDDSMVICRTQFDAATATDGAGITRIYAIGGMPDGGGITYASVEAYDPATHSWILRASLPQPRSGLAAVTGVDGKIYVFGGFDGSSAATATVMVYDPVANHWVTQPNPMPTARGSLAAAVFPPTGKIYVFGGYNGAELRTVEEYNPVSDTWATKEEMPQNSGISAVYSRCLNKILVLGGSRNTAQENAIFDPTIGSGGTWELGPPIPFPPLRSAPTSIESPDGTIFTIGGEVISDASNIVARYFPLDATWQTADSMPTARSGPGVARLGDRVYVLGGEKDSSVNAVCRTVESYGALGAGSECCPHASGDIANASSRGFDFWVVEPTTVYLVDSFAIMISNSTGCGPAAVTVFNALGGTTSVDVAEGEVRNLTFPPRSPNGTGDNIGSNAVYHVTSNKPIVVYTMKPATPTEKNDAGLVLPVPSLGNDYRVGSYYEPSGLSSGNFLQVVATQPGLTHVDVVDAQGISKDSVDIPQGNCFQRVDGVPMSSPSTDMTGWRIVADKPVAAVGGVQGTYVLGEAADLLYEQLLPVFGAVDTYAVCPTRTRPLGCGPDCAVDLFRFVGLHDGTSITTSPAVASGTINAGGYLQIVTDTPFVLTASKPVVGYQYLTSQDSAPGTNPAPGTGDPELLDVLPVEQFLSDYLVLSPVASPSGGWDHQFLNVIVPTGTSLQLDGSPVAWPCEPAGIVHGVQYCCERGEVGQGTHHVTGDRDFGLTVSGFIRYGSYAYLAGAKVPATFCIQGTSSGQSYTWWLDLLDDEQHSTSEPFEMNAPGVLPVGATADVLASSLADRININPVSISLGIQAVATGSCFQVLGTDHFSLRVGHGSVTSCRVTSQGCTYNPTIYLGQGLPPAASGVKNGGRPGGGTPRAKLFALSGDPDQGVDSQTHAANAATALGPPSPQSPPPPQRGITRWGLLQALRSAKKYGRPVGGSCFQDRGHTMVAVKTWSSDGSRTVVADPRTRRVRSVAVVDDRSGGTRAAALAIELSARQLEDAVIEAVHTHRGWIPIRVEVEMSASAPRALVTLMRAGKEETIFLELGRGVSRQHSSVP